MTKRADRCWISNLAVTMRDIAVVIQMFGIALTLMGSIAF